MHLNVGGRTLRGTMGSFINDPLMPLFDTLADWLAEFYSSLQDQNRSSKP